MNKFKSLLGATLACGFIFLQQPGTAYAMDWSFAEHPHPKEKELTAEETAFIEAASKPNASRWDIPWCERKLRAAFMIYTRRHPAFEKRGTVESLYAAWRRAHAADRDFDYSYCLFSRPYHLMSLQVRFEITEKFRFCGEFFPAKTKADQEALQLIDEMLFNANTGRPYAVDDLVYESQRGEQISLNPDVEYYFRKRAIKGYESVSDLYETAHLLDFVSPERRKFVENAAEKGDLEAVLDTTGPCED